MATTVQRHEVPTDERARLIREFQQVLQRDKIVAPDSLTASIPPDKLPRTDNVVNTGFIPGGTE
jgi:hypothetical protein